MVDLPVPDAGQTLNFGDAPGYSFSDETITFNIADYESSTGKFNTYALPVYSAEEAVKNMVVNYSTNGGEEKNIKGDSGHIKTSTLTEQRPIEDSTMNDSVTYDTDEIRMKFLISSSYPDTYFIILFVQTYAGNNVIMEVTASAGEKTITCSPENSVSSGEEYMTAGNIVQASLNEYTSVVVNSANPVALNFPELN